MSQLPPFQEWLVQLASMLSNIMLGIAAIVGIIGLRQWRSELIGKTKFDIARKMMGLAYKFRDEFAAARRPVFPGYSAGRIRQEGETPEQRALLDEEYARKSRLSPLAEIFQQLREESWQAEIIFRSEEIQSYITPFEERYKEFHYALHSYYYKKFGGEGRDTTGEWLIINSGEEDEISKSIDASVNGLSKYMKKHLQ